MQENFNESVSDVNIVLINYANNLFKKSQKINSETAKSIGNFNKIISYKEKDIEKDFKEKNKKILIQKRGGGYWLWKPYFIKKTLKNLNDGDFLFYCDSGSYFVNPIDDVVNLCLSMKQDVIPFELIHYEKHWTKRDAFVLMDCDSGNFHEQKQRLGSYILIRKSKISMSFVTEWLNYAQDGRIITDIENLCGLENYAGFKEHRHDQSIFSLLSKKYGFIAYRDPSQYGNDLKEFYPDSKYEQILKSTRKRSFPLHIQLKKYLSYNKAILKSFFNFNHKN